jgi:hypothetical protein
MRGDRAALACALGAIATASALADQAGRYGPGALALVTLAAACAAWATAMGQPWRKEEPGARARAPWPGPRAAGLLLRAGVLVSLAALLVVKPGTGLRPAHPPAFHALATMALVVTSVPRATATAWVRRLRFPLLAALWTAMAVVVLQKSPQPCIDVWHYQQIASEALWRGHNPYSIGYPDICVHEKLPAGQAAPFSYPPLTIYTGLPAWLVFGDVRYALLAATLAAAWAIRRLGHTAMAEDAALVLLFHPKAFFMLEQAWTEPLLLAFAALAAVAALEIRGRWSWMASGAALGLAAASKQFSLLVLPPFLLALARPWRLKAAAVAAGVATLTFLPFLVLSPGDLWYGLVTYQRTLPFREDSLSWMVPLSRMGGGPMPAWPALAAATVVMAATFPRRSSMALAATSAWATLSAFVLLANRSHFNYHWLAMGLALAAAVLHGREAAEAGRREP